jgi:hypothetical protein
MCGLSRTAQAVRLAKDKEVASIPSFNSQCQAVSDEREFKQAMDTSLDGKGSVPFVFSSEISTRLSRDIRCSETSMTTIIRCTITSQDTEVVSSARLTPEAARPLQHRLSRSWSSPLQRHPQEVLDKFGQYYIYSYISKSSIMIVSTHSTSTKEELQELKAHSASSYTGPTQEKVSANVVFNHLKNNNHSSVATYTKVDCKGDNLDGISEGLSTNDATKIFENFRKNHRPERCFAILRPLSSINPKISRPMESIISPGMKDEWMECLYLTNRAQSSAMVEAQRLAPRLLSLTDEIKILILAKEQDEEVFSKLIERRSGYETLIADFDRRMHLIEKSNARAKLELTK